MTARRSRAAAITGAVCGAAGALIGAAIGALAAAPEPRRSDRCVPLGPDGSCWNVTVGGTPRSMCAAFGAGYGALAGGLVGMLTGSIPTDRWTPVTRDRRVRVIPDAGGVVLRVRVPMRTAAR